jgi:molybdenum cofactor cytidylyltransferase
MTVAAIILAAGLSRRLGRPKQLLDWGGVPLVRHCVMTVRQSNLAAVAVVVGHQADAVRASVADLAVPCIANDAYASGQASSVACGAQWFLTQSYDALMVMMCDQPLLTADHINACIDAWYATQPAVLIPRVAGQATNPVIWASPTVPLLTTLTGDQGGRVLFGAGQVVPQFWPIDAPELLRDIDTDADYEMLRDGLRR